MLFKNNISQAKLIDEKWFGIVKNTWGRGTAEKIGRKGMGDRQGSGGTAEKMGKKRNGR